MVADPPLERFESMTRAVIVVPCYNEARRLPTARFTAFAIDHAVDVRFLFVNDGSTDETAEVIASLVSAHPSLFELLDLPHNVGKAEAVRLGVLSAREGGCEYVGFWDADLATPLAEIPAFIAQLDATPELLMVIGARIRLLGREVERRFVRHVLGRVFATGASLVLSLPVYDTQCGAKLFRDGPLLSRLFGAEFSSRWVFDVELIARLGAELRWDIDRLSALIYEHPLERWRDVEGSKVRPRDLPRAFFDLVRIGARYRLKLGV